MKTTRLLVLCIGFLVLASNGNALTYPSTVPAGETAGGEYRTYFDNMFSSQVSCYGAGKVVAGFTSTGVPICQAPSVATSFFLTGQTSGDTIRFNGTNWIRNNVIYNNGTNVGIGTATPGAKLEVAGQIKITGGTPGAGKVLTSDAAGLATWQNVTATTVTATGIIGGTQHYLPRFGTGGIGLYLSQLFDNGTYVGISNPSPRGRLDVNGQVIALQRFTIANDTGTTTPTWHIDNGSGTDRFRIFRQPNILSAGTELLTIFSGGNVGIGTATPGAKLEVAGQIKITGGTPSAGQVLTSDATGLATWETPSVSSVTATGITGGTQFYISRFGTGGNGLYASSIYQNGSNIGIGLTTASNQLALSSLGTAALPAITIGNDPNTGWFNPTTDTIAFSTNGSERMRIDSSGRVGIGINVPAHALDVAGNINLSGFVGVGSGTPNTSRGLNVDIDIPNSNGYGLYSNVTSVGTFSANRSYYGSYNIVTNNADNGAFTSTVFGSYNRALNTSSSGTGAKSLYGSFNYAQNYNTGATVSYAYGGVFQVDQSFGSISNGYGIYIGNVDGVASAFGLYQADSALKNYFAGNLGIGTTTPGAKLEVAGQVKITGGTPGAGKVLTSDASGLATWQNVSAANQVCPGTGSGNTCYGIGAGNSLTTGYNNTAVGSGVLASNTIGYNNTANGTNALYSNTTGYRNLAQGVATLSNNTTGYNNVAQGISALYSNTTGYNNTANGTNALYSNTTGNGNTALGSYAGSGLTTGNNNIFIGNNVQPNISTTASNQLNIGNWIYGNGGNIGIGVGSPGAKLEVAGQVKITGGTPGAGKVLTSDSAGLATWQNVTATTVTATGITGGSQFYLPKFGTGGNGLYASQIYNNGSSVGIGTATPVTSLDLSGALSQSSNSVREYTNVAMYNESTSSLSGTMQIELPNSWSNTMLRVRIVGYDYASGKGAWEAIVSGYNYSSTPTWVNTSTEIRGNAPFNTVRLAHNGSKNVILLGNTSSIWNYPKIVVREVTAGHSNQHSWGSGWTIGRILSEASITGSVTPPIVTPSPLAILQGGNSFGTTVSVGSNDAQSVAIETNNVERMRVDSTGRVGIGTSAPAYTLDVAGSINLSGFVGVGSGVPLSSRGLNVDIDIPNTDGYGLYSNVTAVGTFSANRSYYGSYNVVTNNAENSIYSVESYGAFNYAVNTFASTGTGARRLYGSYNYARNNATGATITDAYGGIFQVDQSLGTINNGYGIYIGNVDGATNAYGIYQQDSAIKNYFAGNVGIGITSPSNQLALSSLGTAALPAITIGNDPNTGWFNPTTDTIAMSTNGTERIRIGSGGYIGIGTTTPSDLVEIRENVGWNYLKLLSDDSGVGLKFNSMGASGFDGTIQYGSTKSMLFYTDMANSASADMTITASGNVGIGTATPSTKLEVAGQVKITGGTPGAGKVLTSDSTGLATWSSTISGATATGIVGGTQNYVSKFGTGGNGLYASQLFDNGSNIGIGTASPAYKLDVYGNGRFTGNLTVSGNLIVDKLVNRTVTNISVSGSILPDSATPVSYRNLGSDTQRWNNLFLNGQIKIVGGTPGAGKVLTSDSTGLATWSSVLSGATATGIVGGTQNYVPRFGTGGNGLYASAIYQNGSNIAIGTGTASARLTLDSGIANTSGLRLTRLSSTSPTYTGAAVGLGIDSAGNLVPVSNGDVVVYDGIGRNGTTPSPNPDVPDRQISYDFNRYFLIPTKQSFVVSDGNGAGYNAPYFKEDGTSGLCSWNGAGGSSPYDCATADPVTGLSASPNNSFTMTARGTSYGYQIALGARGDAPLFARSGKWYNSTSNYGSGLYLSDGVTPTPWQKVLTVPANHIEYFYVNIGYNSQLQAISGGGNIGMGTSVPDMRLVLAYSGSTGSTSEMMRIERGLKGADSNMVTAFGTPYLLIGGKENRTNSIQTIGFGYNSGSSYQPAEIGLVTTNTTGNTQGDFVFATRSGTGNTAPIERMRIFSNGNVAIGSTTASSKFEIWNNGSSLFHMRGTNNIGIGSGAVRPALTGNADTGLGHEALYSLTTGYSNTAVGHQSMNKATSSYNNSAFGKEAIYNDSDGTWNVAMGYQALRQGTSTDFNTAIGAQALYNLGTGSGNVAVGYNALYGATTTASSNTAIGYQAGSGITTGRNNVMIGYGVQSASATASNQLNIGNWIYGSGGNIGIGTSAPAHTLDVVGNINLSGFVGVGSGAPLPSRGLNVDIDISNTNGYGLYSNVTSVGTFSANRSYYGSYNAVTNSANNSAYSSNSIGSYNYALNLSTTGTGAKSLFGSYNYTQNYITGSTVANAYAGYFTVGQTYGTISNGYGIYIANVDGATNAFGLYQDDSGIKNYFAGNVGIGTTTPSEKLHVNGNILATQYLYTSDKNLKKNVESIKSPLQKVLALNGYSFVWKNTGVQDLGLIAQEVEKIFPELVHTDEVTGLKSVQYGNLVAPIIEAIKSQQSLIQKQNEDIESLREENRALRIRIENIEKRLR